jgi:hypothetical protein
LWLQIDGHYLNSFEGVALEFVKVSFLFSNIAAIRAKRRRYFCRKPIETSVYLPTILFLLVRSLIFVKSVVSKKTVSQAF